MGCGAETGRVAPVSKARSGWTTTMHWTFMEISRPTRAGFSRRAVSHRALPALAVATALAAPATALAQRAAPPPFTAEQAEAGENVYRGACAPCHGSALDGTLGPPLLGKAFRANWYAGDRTLGDLFEQIARNMPMTAPGSLSREQYAAVTAFILQRNGHRANGDSLVPDAESLAAYPLSPPDEETEGDGR